MNNRVARLVAILLSVMIVAPIRAQLTSLAKVTLDCTPSGPMYLVVEGNERDWIPLKKVGDFVWTGEKRTDPLMEPGRTYGSLRMGNARTEGVPSYAGTHDKRPAAVFAFHCNDLNVYDLNVETSSAIDISYVRTMPKDSKKGRDSQDSSWFLGTKDILDLRFSKDSLRSKRAGESKPTDHYETLRLQPGRVEPLKDACGLLVNDPVVLEAARKGLKRADLIRLIAEQGNRKQFCQVPELSSVAIDFNEKTIPPFKCMTLTLTPPRD